MSILDVGKMREERNLILSNQNGTSYEIRTWWKSRENSFHSIFISSFKGNIPYLCRKEEGNPKQEDKYNIMDITNKKVYQKRLQMCMRLISFYRNFK